MTIEERVSEAVEKMVSSGRAASLISGDLHAKYKQGLMSLDLFEESFFLVNGHYDWQAFYGEGESVPLGIIHDPDSQKRETRPGLSSS